LATIVASASREAFQSDAQRLELVQALAAFLLLQSTTNQSTVSSAFSPSSAPPSALQDEDWLAICQRVAVVVNDLEATALLTFLSPFVDEV
jgi:hypothetical protein